MIAAIYARKSIEQNGVTFLVKLAKVLRCKVSQLVE